MTPPGAAGGTAAVPIGRVYWFGQIMEAHTDMEQNRANGKLGHGLRRLPMGERMKIAVLGAGRVVEAVAAVDVVLVAIPGPAVKHLSPEMKDNGPA